MSKKKLKKELALFSIQELQYEGKVFKQFRSPTFDSDKIINSSAYKRELSFMPFGKTNGSDRMLLNEKAKSLRCRLNSRGLKMQPWRTPLGKDRVFLLPSLTEHVEFAYKLFIRLKNFPPILYCNSLYRSLSCQTESKAFLKSTKHAYTLVW